MAWRDLVSAPGREATVSLAACAWSILQAMLFMETISDRWRHPARVGLVAIVVVSTVGVRLHLVDWQEASRLRDTVLASAVDVIRSRHCRPTSFSNLPESVGGAYVFGNGFTEALALETGRLTRPLTAGPDDDRCSVRWDGKAFRAE
jgi:hypothetical protein